jgi:ATP-dependent Lhr-like helicase
VRWRWNATIALAVQRMRNGQRLPPQWQRNQAEDLVAVVFPDQLACLENIRGEREIPDHPLVEQTIGDCLGDTMDIDGLEALLERIRSEDVEIRCLDLNAPSPLAAEIINARPYAFLDDGEAENRRTRAISQNPNDLADAATLSIITVDAARQVRSEAWIRPRNPDELHDGLLQLGFLTQEEFTSGQSSTGAVSGEGDATSWGGWFKALAADFRVCLATLADRRWWLATERRAEFAAVHPDARIEPDTSAVFPLAEIEREAAMTELLRSRLSALGPAPVSTLAEDFGVAQADTEQALLKLQAEGFAMVMEGATSVVSGEKTWCERRLLARIHRYSRESRRRTARPVPPAAFMRFLLEWHGLDEPAGELEQVLGLLEGWTAPVAAWEQGLIAKRCADYTPQRLDEQFLSGFVTWFRPRLTGESRQQLLAATPIAIVPRRQRVFWRGEADEGAALPAVGGAARKALRVLEAEGAMFSSDLEQRTGLLPVQMEQAAAELAASGLITADAFSPLRWLIRPEAEKRRRQKALRGRRGGAQPGLLGRWSITGESAGVNGEDSLFPDQARLAAVCEALLRRYGVVFRAVLERESLIPPWRYLLRYLRRMEDRGEVYGGRFVDGFSGEQFALPEAVGLLRAKGKSLPEREIRVISAADPLNLGGIITPGVKTAARAGSRILLLDGVPAARIQGEELELLAPEELGSSEAERYLRVVVAKPWQAA